MVKKWKDAYRQIALGSLLLLVVAIIPLVILGGGTHIRVQMIFHMGIIHTLYLMRQSHYRRRCIWHFIK